MSKMSEIAMELDDQAMELGFESYEDAIERGGYTTYFNGTTYVLAKANADEQEVAHEAWLKEKREILNELNSILNAINGQAYNNFSDYELLTFIKNNKQIIAKAIEFIEKGEI